jgi:CheY-like chemotaxis protein
MTQSTQVQTRVLVVEDEYLIRMLLEDMLADLGYAVAGAVGTVAEASDLATKGEFSAAILAERGLPFIFVTGYGERILPDRYRDRPTLQKPFQANQLDAMLSGLVIPV